MFHFQYLFNFKLQVAISARFSKELIGTDQYFKIKAIYSKDEESEVLLFS